MVLYKLQVSSNGLISARERYTQFVPSPFTREFSAFPHAIIAPLWADFDSRDQGSIYYRVTNDSEVLDQIVDTISNLNPDLNSYTPKQALIATWEDIIPYSALDDILVSWIPLLLRQFSFLHCFSTTSKLSLQQMEKDHLLFSCTEILPH